MKVIKNGKTSKVVTCPRCECLFRYCKNDIIKSQEIHKSYLVGTVTLYYVACPECNYQFVAEEEPES